MTQAYLRNWLDDANHYRMQLQGDAADNPDQRIAEDIQLFVVRTLRIGLGFLNSVVTILSFVVILWGLSNAAPLHLFGSTVDIPGYLVWAALIYSVLGTLFTHLIGRPLIRLIFTQQRYEADFRFNLVRTRENSEQIALLVRRTGRNRPADRPLPERRQSTGSTSCGGRRSSPSSPPASTSSRSCFPISWSARLISPARSSSAR